MDTVDDNGNVQPEILDIMHRHSGVQIAIAPDWQFRNCGFPVGKRTTRGEPLEAAMEADDIEALDRLIRLRTMCQGYQFSPETYVHQILESDSPALLEKMIREYGFGVPLRDEEEVTHEDGAEGEGTRSPSKLYLGLDVHGKKRKDLAKHGDPDAPSEWTPDHVPILWNAARKGSTKIVQWLASPASLDAYRTFMETSEDDRAKTLKRINGLESELPAILGRVPNAYGENAVWAALLGDGKKAPAMVSLLYQLFPDLNKTFTHTAVKNVELTPIGLVCVHNSPTELFDFFLSRGADVMALDSRGYVSLLV